MASPPCKRRKLSAVQLGQASELEVASAFHGQEDYSLRLRLRSFVPRAPVSFYEIYSRAMEQRFFVLNRMRCGTECCPEEKIELAGSTGNIYTVVISRLPSCTCPYALDGKQCKHIVFVMCRVLEAKWELLYQLALLPSELRQLFERAPPINNDQYRLEDNRKPLEDCPICFTALEKLDDTVYCLATCGQNIHRECFEIWASTKRRGNKTVTCPMCRSKWHDCNGGNIRSEGYENVAHLLGISRRRTSSSRDKRRRFVFDEYDEYHWRY
ncbi:hypothetical protein GGR50DRAFT_591415 [Xylaria sp. CBS 124048]|nr:hypothetical protein GGR50DRAFT_591415 [Xylaria sp. CBS 124048]